MKMADGGWRPAYNIQYAVDTESLAAVGVYVSQAGNDMGLMMPMIAQLQHRFPEKTLQDYLMDGGFVKHEDICEAARLGITALAPVRKSKGDTNDSARYEPRPGDPEEVKQWRHRMSLDAAKTQYKGRAASIELFNAQARNHELQRLPVRGLAKVLAVALWYAITHNFSRYLSHIKSSFSLPQFF